jgi:hypothetical protein
MQSHGNVPTTWYIQQLQDFLGFVNFYRHGVACILKPMRDVLQSGQVVDRPVSWSPVMHQAFQVATPAMAAAVPLVHPIAGPACRSVVRWPKFRPKRSKGAGEKKVGWKYLWPKFGRTLPKVAEKGPKKIF